MKSFHLLCGITRFTIHTGRHRAITIAFAVAAACMLTLSACSPESGSSPGTGNLAFSVQMPDAPSDKQGMHKAISDSCDEYGLASVIASIYDSGGIIIARGGPWACSSANGTIFGVEEGINRTLVLSIYDLEGAEAFRGVHSGITIIDGETTDLGVITVRSTTNNAPAIDAIDDAEIQEAQAITIKVSATDADGDTLTYSASDLPAGATFDEVTHTFTWTPGCTQTGEYEIVFTVTDNADESASSTETLIITVTDINCTPEIETIQDQTVTEGEEVNFTVTATDPDGDDVTYTAEDVPTGAVFNETTHTFTWPTDSTDAGEYDVTFTVLDNGTPPASTSSTVTITVNESNRAPVFQTSTSHAVSLGNTLEFTVYAIDPNGDTVTYLAVDIPSNAEFSTGSGLFQWSPDEFDMGEYNAIFTASDNGHPSLTSTLNVLLTVVTNQAPILETIGTRSTNSDSPITIELSASDPDGDNLTYYAADLPTGATTSMGITPPTFTWQPNESDKNSEFKVLFIVTDDGSPRMSAYEEVKIEVETLTNHSPVLEHIGNKETTHGDILTFEINADDYDSDPILYYSQQIAGKEGYYIEGSLHTTTGIYTVDTDLYSAGNYYVTFIAQDIGGKYDTEEVTITIDPESGPTTNHPPELTPIGSRSVYTNDTITFTVTATDPDSDILTYSISEPYVGAGLPCEPSCFDETTHTFSWTPASAGYFYIKFIVSDGITEDDDFEIMYIWVKDA